MNNFDKINLPKNSYTKFCIAKNFSTLGVDWKEKTSGEVVLTLSGKVMSNSFSLGSITVQNYTQLLKNLYENAYLDIKEDDFLNNSTVYIVDVKKDIQVEKDTSDYISKLREVFYASTRKIEVPIFINKLGFAESLLLKPVVKTLKDSFSIYSKYAELQATKNKYPNYYQQFDVSFLNDCKQIIRFERRLQSFKAIRDAFHIKRNGAVCVKDILFSEVDVVKEKLMQLIGDNNL